MTERAKFTVQLIDKVSGDARKAKKSISDLGDAAAKTSGRFRDVNGKLREANGRFVQGAGAAKMFGVNLSGAMDVFKGNLLTMAATKLVGIGAAAVGAGYNMITFGQNSRLAFDALAKHGATGGQMFEHARELAKRFGLDVIDTTDTYRKFLALQFDPAAIDGLIRMGADLRALGADAEGVQGVFMALGQIKGKGRLQGEELLQLAERGVSTVLVQEEIGKLMGGKNTQAVQALMQKGQVNAETGLRAIENAIKRKLGESRLGEAGAKFADSTIDGMVGRFKAFGQDSAIKIFEKATAPISRALGASLDRLISFVDSPAGGVMIEQLAKSIERLAVAGAEFGGELAKKFIEADWAKIGQEISEIAQGMVAAARAAIKLAEMLGIGAGRSGKDAKPLQENRASVGGFAAAGAVVGLPFGPLGSLVGGAAGASMAMLENAGMDIGVWLSGGIKSDTAKSAAHEAGWSLGDSVSGGMMSALEIHSPSRVAMRMGEQLGAGLAIGTDKSAAWASSSGADLANASLDGMYGAQSPAFSFGDMGGGSSGGLQSLTLTQNIDGGGKDAEEIGRIAARETRREVESFFRQLAMET